MRPHPFDALSGALGLVVAGIGALVAVDGTASIDTGWWLALGALVIGVGLVPWTRGRRPLADGEVDPSADQPSDPPHLQL